jgi:hypothetical protein
MNKHAVAFMRTRESYLARSLFSGQVYTPKTDDLLIDFGDLFGVAPMNATLDLSATDSSTLRAIDDMVSQITEAAQSQAAAVERILVFAKSRSIAICVSALQWKRLSAMSAHLMKGT